MIKEIQVFESKDFNLVPFVVCFFQLLLSQLEKFVYFAFADLAIKSLCRT